MTRQEITKLLEILVSAYPMAADKITDAKGTVMAFELAFGEMDAGRVYKAARLHMMSSPYFPTVSDIMKNLGRTGIYEASSEPRLESGANEDTSGCSECIYEDCDRKSCAFGED